MRDRLFPLTIPDRPSRYLRVEAGGKERVFRLPNEKRQHQLLTLVAQHVQGGDQLSIVSKLEVLAVLVGVCWWDPERELETPLPWSAADQMASAGLATGERDLEAFHQVLVDYGATVLEELDTEDLGDLETVGPCFSSISVAMGRNFVPQEVVDERLGFIKRGRASVA